MQINPRKGIMMAIKIVGGGNRSQFAIGSKFSCCRCSVFRFDLQTKETSNCLRVCFSCSFYNSKLYGILNLIFILFFFGFFFLFELRKQNKQKYLNAVELYLYLLPCYLCAVLRLISRCRLTDK